MVNITRLKGNLSASVRRPAQWIMSEPGNFGTARTAGARGSRVQIGRLIAIALLLLIALALALPVSVRAQSLSFSQPALTTSVFMNADGTIAIDYVIVFANDSRGAPIDFVDVGLPNASYSLGNVRADVDGKPIRDIERSPYLTYGVALGLGADAIPPGATGTVHMFVDRIEGMFFTDNTDSGYASIQFVPNFFSSEFVHGSTDLTLTLYFPAGLQPEEPRWHSAPRGFPEEPEAGIDSQGRIFYTWRNPSASPDREYKFGASLPKSYLPASEVSSQTELPSPSGTSGSISIDSDALIGMLFCGGVIAFIVLMGIVGVASESRRKRQYLPPTISIGGHGIKRGLTAVEAAILLETPMDKIMTMILFATIKKGAASVLSRDPLTLDVADPLPEGLRTYEIEFLEAFKSDDKRKRRRELQEMMVNLVKIVAKKIKGFSKRETVNYYHDIMKRAWAQVESADTPEVKSQAFDEVMEWTMLDRNFDDRTRDVFQTGPVFVPTWWGRYDPGFGGAPAARPIATSTPSSGKGGVSLPTLPGSTFAANMVTGIQNFSAGVVGNLTEFTGAITQKTNPPPPPSKSSGSWRSGGGSSCACACAGCACACACAGGGR